MAADLRIGRDTSDNITITWQRRTRYQVRIVGPLGVSVPLGEQSEPYELDIYTDDSPDTLLRTISATTTSASYSAAEQAADGITPGDPVRVVVYQLSAIVGRGYPVEKAA